MPNPRLLLVAALSLASSALGQPPRFTPDPASYELHPSLEMTLWASEPDVVDPVAMCFDEDGRAYVAEMRDYPEGLDGKGKPGGTIRLLEDTGGYNRADRSVVFADNLSFPTSVTPWRGGVLVTAPPQILWLKDTNGDGRADVREVIFDGFTRGVTDSNVNGLRYGLDNRIHGVNGGNGGLVHSPKKPDVETRLGNSDFSFNPDTGELALTFQTTGGFGLIFDEWGRSFGTYNINHVQQRIMPRRYAERFPGFPAVELTTSISDHEEMARIYPISVAKTRPNHPEQAGYFSSAGGMGYISSAAFPDELQGSILVCDVVGNLVHRDVLVPDGPIFRATRATNELTREFLASRDPAFRPVGVETGPDGALYLLDMQRDVIEHPDYIPAKLKATLNLRAGDDRGRIYRITPKGGLRPVRPRLSEASNKMLVTMLGHPDAWWRLTAQRLLVERRATDVAPQLRDSLRALNRSLEDLMVLGSVVGQSARVESRSGPLTRLHALWTLDGLGVLQDGDLLSALTDGAPGVRENALLMAEPRATASTLLPPAMQKLAFDPSARVCFQAALSLGNLRQEDALAGLQRLLRTSHDSRWMRYAIWSSLGSDSGVVLNGMLVERSWRESRQQARVDTWREFSELIGARADKHPDAVSFLLGRVDNEFSEQGRVALCEGLVQGLRRSGARLSLTRAARDAVNQLTLGSSRDVIRASWQLTRALGLPENDAQKKVLRLALTGAVDHGRSTEQRVTDVRLLEFGTPEATTNTLFSLLAGAEPGPVQSAALQVLRRLDDPAIGAGLMDRWRAFSPSLRPAVVNVLLQRRQFQEPLVAALEQGRVKVGELNLDLEQRRRLLHTSSGELRERAAKFISDEEYAHRKTVVDDWLARLPATGDAKRGRIVFEQVCSNCHAVGGLGYKIGPDLTAISHRSVEDIVSNILDPNMAINPSYVAYTVEMKSGEIQTGILQSESGDSITLLQALGTRVVVPRRDIVRLESSGQSLMPEGLEAGRTPQDMRDLVAFLQEPL